MRMTFVLAAVLAAGVPAATWQSATQRTVYVVATDDDKKPVKDLTPADFVVKEGGKEREIVKAEPATTPMRVALAVEERLTMDTTVRQGLYDFMKRVIGSAEISLVTIGIRNTTVVDYTNKLEPLVAGINGFSMNPAKESAVAEGVLDLAMKAEAAKAPRPVIVVVAVNGGAGGVDAKMVIDRLRQSGASMYVVTLAGTTDASAMGVGNANTLARGDQVLGDGAKQSGGRRIDVAATGAMPRALMQIAGDLEAQYAITYTLPDGVKPDRRFNASVKRRGVSLRAPSQIPDR